MAADLLVATCGRKALYKRDNGTYYAMETIEPEDPASLGCTGVVRKRTELGSDRATALDRLFEWR